MREALPERSSTTISKAKKTFPVSTMLRIRERTCTRKREQALISTMTVDISGSPCFVPDALGIHDEQLTFPCIDWNDNTEDSSGSVDINYCSNSLQDCMISSYTTKKAQRCIHRASDPPQEKALRRQHLTRSMAFFDLDSLLCSSRRCD
jgi:hypothetical protein